MKKMLFAANLLAKAAIAATHPYVPVSALLTYLSLIKDDTIAICN